MAHFFHFLRPHTFGSINACFTYRNKPKAQHVMRVFFTVYKYRFTNVIDPLMHVRLCRPDSSPASAHTAGAADAGILSGQAHKQSDVCHDQTHLIG